MIKLIIGCVPWAYSIFSIFLTFFSESIFEKNSVVESVANIIGIQNKEEITSYCTTCNKLLLFILIYILTIIGYSLYKKFRKSVTIKNDNYCIQVEYGDLLKIQDCKKVIAFDECFTTTVGDKPADIKESSICGTYLKNNPQLNIKKLIHKASLIPESTLSEYNNQTRYKSGKIVPNGDDLLLSFAMLDSEGRGVFQTVEKYIESLFTLWAEIEKYYCMKDVCVPILGSGITRFGKESNIDLSKQELLDIMICTYKVSSRKLKLPNKLRIICKKTDDFSLNKIQGI